jgi:hypothetical protein
VQKAYIRTVVYLLSRLRDLCTTTIENGHQIGRVFHSDSSGVAGAACQERRAVPDRSREVGEGLGLFIGIGALVAVAGTRRR